RRTGRRRPEIRRPAPAIRPLGRPGGRFGLALTACLGELPRAPPGVKANHPAARHFPARRIHLTDAQTAKTPDATPGDTATPPPGGMAYARSSLALFAVLLVVDQVTKVLAKAHLERQPFEAIPFVTIIPGFF